MKEKNQNVSVRFPEWYDDLAEFEHSHKGYLNDVTVSATGGRQYLLNFLDPARLQQNLTDNIATGVNYFIAKNLVIVPFVTKDEILSVIRGMCNEGLLESACLPEKVFIV